MQYWYLIFFFDFDQVHEELYRHSFKKLPLNHILSSLFNIFSFAFFNPLPLPIPPQDLRLVHMDIQFRQISYLIMRASSRTNESRARIMFSSLYRNKPWGFISQKDIFQKSQQYAYITWTFGLFRIKPDQFT